MFIFRKPFSQLLSLCIQHAFIDFASVYVVLTFAKEVSINIDKALFYVALYAFIAFATQFIFGIALDKTFKAKQLLVFSFILLVLGLLLARLPLYSVVLLGFANSLFHVSAGSIVLKMYKNKAFNQGLFIAPGALGLMLGTLLSGTGQYMLSIIFFLAIALWYFNIRTINQDLFKPKSETTNIVQNKIVYLVIILLLMVIAIRSLVGASVFFPWKSQVNFVVYSYLLFGGIFTGKVLGGWLADKYGLTKVGVISLIVCIPFIYFGIYYPILGIFGMLIFQMTTSITLTIINYLTGYRAGLSFGLTTLFLFLGSALMYTRYITIFRNVTIVFLLLILASLSLFIATGLFKLFTLKNSTNTINI